MVGTILLEMIETVDDESIKRRANLYLDRLIDGLAKMNSKASEEFIRNFTDASISQGHPSQIEPMVANRS